jgi:tetratricopeptide (TPR) repeat protein
VSEPQASERQEFLERSLADLAAERAAGDLGEEDYLELKTRYSEALERSRCDSLTESGTETHPKRNRTRAIAAVLAIGMLAVGAGALVARSSGERLPGETTSGDIELGTEDRLAQAQALVEQGRALDAIKLYDEILRDDPRQPAALAQRGWVLRGAGLIDEGLAYIERAIDADPTYAEAYFFKGMILWRDKKDPAAGVVELRRFLAGTPSPDDAATVEELLRQAEAEAATVPQQ